MSLAWKAASVNNQQQRMIVITPMITILGMSCRRLVNFPITHMFPHWLHLRK